MEAGIKMYPREICCDCVDWLEVSRDRSFCEHDGETCGFIMGGEFLTR
jgi:hypothetical protein